jgi:hypothetical protein
MAALGGSSPPTSSLPGGSSWCAVCRPSGSTFRRWFIFQRFLWFGLNVDDMLFIGSGTEANKLNRDPFGPRDIEAGGVPVPIIVVQFWRRGT